MTAAGSEGLPAREQMQAALREQFDLGLSAGVESMSAALEAVIAAQRERGLDSISLDALQGAIRSLVVVAKSMGGSK